MTRRPTPLLPTTTSLARRTERVVMTNVLVGLVFVVHLSAFPAEKELLYPPLTFLQPTGWSMEHAVGGVKFTVIEVEPFAG